MGLAIPNLPNTEYSLCLALLGIVFIASCSDGQQLPNTGSQAICPIVHALIDTSKPGGFFCSSPSVTDPRNGSTQNRGIYQNEGLVISCTDFAELQKRGLSGDGQAAKELAMFFLYTTEDYNEGLYWLTISAEDGNKSATSDLSYLFGIISAAPEYKLRSRFWQEKAAE